MKYEDLYVNGVGSWYPKPVPVDHAVADGRYEAALQERTGMVSVAIAGEDDSQPEMAVRAGLQAVAQSGLADREFGLLLHATAGFNGLDGWNVGSYLQHRIIGGEGTAFEIRQLSNGAVGSIELAAGHLRGGTDRSAALITASDRFEAPVWDRWHMHPGLIFGDGASALVLSRRPGFARLVSSVTVAHPELEGMQRGSLPFTANSDPAQHPVRIIDRTRDFAARELPLSRVVELMDAALVRTATAACAEAGIRPTDAEHVIMPNFGLEMVKRETLDPLGIALERTPWQWAVETGHVGATDQFGALDHLAHQGLLEPGQRVLMTGIGGGFNWTSVVLEIVGRPAPTPR
ncbi:ketoacyl-ACP synthase III family protein [Kitasatospora sp. NPDC002040]|uniref:ketoacyl-ACP synthase III family protein n=1 Tax=Kitasatospora sp. NPDC002040 TaxID=3154661 RepID=UPI00331E9218